MDERTEMTVVSNGTEEEIEKRGFFKRTIDNGKAAWQKLPKPAKIAIGVATGVATGAGLVAGGIAAYTAISGALNGDDDSDESEDIDAIDTVCVDVTEE